MLLVEELYDDRYFKKDLMVILSSFKKVNWHGQCLTEINRFTNYGGAYRLNS
jgi:hypothetical protein